MFGDTSLTYSTIPTDYPCRESGILPSRGAIPQSGYTGPGKAAGQTTRIPALGPNV